MTVRVEPVFPAGGRVTTDFQDSFQRPDEPFYLGNDWYTIESALGINSGVDLALNINVNSLGATFGGGVATYTPRSINIPVPISATAVRARSLTRGLFAEMQFKSKVVGVSCEAGPAVMINPNSTNGYWLSTPSAGADCLLYRGLGAPATLSTAFTYAPDDVIRLESTFAPGANTIRVYQNGVLRATVVDNDALRPIDPSFYGVVYWGSAASGSLRFQNFSGGVL